MVKIIFSTKCGRLGYYKNLFSYSFLCGIFTSLLFIIPYIINILNSYGTQGLDAPIQSIQKFSDLSITFSVGGFIILFLTIHIIGSLISVAIISGISSLCRSRTTAYIVNIALFAVPIILLLMFTGIKWSCSNCFWNSVEELIILKDVIDFENKIWYNLIKWHWYGDVLCIHFMMKILLEKTLMFL